MKILHLTLKKKWFDMIYSGEKKEEYREIKSYWIKRLIDEMFSWDCATKKDIEQHYEACRNGFFKKFDRVIFKNGYSRNAPSVTVELKGIAIGLGMKSWGAEPDTEYFILQLGEIIN